MLILAKITRTLAGGYAKYLEGKSQAPALGDYYLKEGERAEAPGRWAQGATQFGLDPGQPVTGEQLHMLMEVRRPDTGEELRRAGGTGEAVAAIDATFSAPKSVSAVWALAGPELRAEIERAHETAIDRALTYATRHVRMLRRRLSQDTAVHEKPTGVVARAAKADEHEPTALLRDAEHFSAELQFSYHVFAAERLEHGFGEIRAELRAADSGDVLGDERQRFHTADRGDK